ncbi:MAG: DUF4405 domain-containing protein [Clostridia bacterium]|nr:DUF4405 domain-containing protein [Clostridia bacterium]
MKKKTAKTILDILMTSALPVLMAYSLAGETLHEIVGTGMFVAFITHHVLNRKATTAMFKGKQKPARIVNTALNIILFAVMIALPVSGIVMSKHLYTFLPTEGLSATARTVHLLLSYWGFALMSLHLGMHADIWLNRLKRKRAAFVTFSVIITLIAAFGAYAFITNRLYEYMFLKTQFVFFDFDKPLILTFGEYLSMIVLFAWIGLWLKALLKLFSKKSQVCS